VQACPAAEGFLVACPGGATATPSGSPATRAAVVHHVIASGGHARRASAVVLGSHRKPGSYSVRLTGPGTWQVGLYYYTRWGQIIDGAPVTVTLGPGGVVRRDLTVHYRGPAMGGLVKLEGAPAGFSSKAHLGIQACPAAVALSIVCRGGRQGYEDIFPGHAYALVLAPGRWTIAAYYRSDTNSRLVVGTPLRLTAAKGHTTTQNLPIRFQGL
jgi:hypothetical protein